MARSLSVRPARSGALSLAILGLIAALGGGVAAVATAGDNQTCTYSVGMSRSDHGAGTWKTVTVTDAPNASFRFDGCSASTSGGQMCVSKYGVGAGVRLLKNQSGKVVGEGVCCNDVTNTVTSVSASCSAATAGPGCAPETSAALSLDPKMYYRLTTAWQGDGKSLDVVNDGTNNKLQLAATGAYSGQLWKITPIGGGYYRLTTAWQGDGKSLDVVNDGTNNKLQLANTGSYSGQMWKISDLGGGYYRLTTAWQGPCKSLDVVNDGTNNKLQLANGGSYSGQMWKLTPTGYRY